MFKVTQQPYEDERSRDYRNILTIIDDSGVRSYWDKGEVEDNYFTRDYRWVKLELQRAYNQGQLDASKEINSMMDAEAKFNAMI